jgi:hypothetical protein
MFVIVKRREVQSMMGQRKDCKTYFDCHGCVQDSVLSAVRR